jgi:hypothetical protein
MLSGFGIVPQISAYTIHHFGRSAFGCRKFVVCNNMTLSSLCNAQSIATHTRTIRTIS